MIVIKYFNTSNRRFKVGAEVSESDDFAPHAAADLKTRGFISDPAPVIAPRAPATKSYSEE